MKKSELAILSVLILAAVFVFNGKINKVTNPCLLYTSDAADE